MKTPKVMNNYVVGNHKELCSNWIDNRGGGYDDENSNCIPVCMKASHFFEEPHVLQTMLATRTFLFVEELQRIKVDTISLLVGVVNLLPIKDEKVLRLHVACTFWNKRVHKMNHLFLDMVDKGREAWEDLYYGERLSESTRQLTEDRLKDVIKYFKERGIRVSNITLGRGLENSPNFLKDQVEYKDTSVVVDPMRLMDPTRLFNQFAQESMNSLLNILD